MQGGVQQIAQRWSPAQIHDTVAAIVRGPAFAQSRESLLGRFARYVLAQIRDLLLQYRGSPTARYAVIAAVAALVLVIIARIVVARDADAQIRRRGASVRGSAAADPWGIARDHAAAGDFTAASHALYAGLLARIARQGDVSLHSSKTGGDYWRELARRGSPMAGDFRVFVRRFDRVMFGTGSATAAEFNELTALAERVLEVRRAA
jgi:uncharacterized protein DUF4129